MNIKLILEIVLPTPHLHTTIHDETLSLLTLLCEISIRLTFGKLVPTPHTYRPTTHDKTLIIRPHLNGYSAVQWLLRPH